MHKLFLYNNGPTGDVIFSRPLYKKVIGSGRFAVTLAASRNDAYLLADLAGDGVALSMSDYASTWQGAVVDLAHLCPADHQPVDVSLGEYEDTGDYQWKAVVEVFNRKMEELGLDYAVEYDASEIPMLDFAPNAERPRLSRPSIFLDNSRDDCRFCHFVFDLERMAVTVPGFDLLCTNTPDTRCENVIDCSRYDLMDRSRLSEQCEVILGMTGHPFNCTLTEANRFKPKAICGYDARSCPTFWDYPGNPLEHLGTMDEVIDFRLATLWDRI